MKTEYYYRVDEFVTTFQSDKGKHEPYSHSEIFENIDLRMAQQAAVEYYIKRLQGFSEIGPTKGKYFLPFAGPDSFNKGENAAFSIVVVLVLKSSEYDEEYTVLGDNFLDMKQEGGFEIEENQTGMKSFDLFHKIIHNNKKNDHESN